MMEKERVREMGGNVTRQCDVVRSKVGHGGVNKQTRDSTRLTLNGRSW